MVFNNTRVIQARLHFRKETGALIEVFCLEPLAPNEYVQMFAQTERCSWLCLVGNLKKWKEGVLSREITVLHVGAGTFKPVKSAEIGDHEMHSEYIVVERSTIEKLIAHHGEAIAVGTTSVRTLESLYHMGAALIQHGELTEEP